MDGDRERGEHVILGAWGFEGKLLFGLAPFHGPAHGRLLPDHGALGIHPGECLHAIHQGGEDGCLDGVAVVLEGFPAQGPDGDILGGDGGGIENPERNLLARGERAKRHFGHG